MVMAQLKSRRMWDWKGPDAAQVDQILVKPTDGEVKLGNIERDVKGRR
jgi:hypothetical protein